MSNILIIEDEKNLARFVELELSTKAMIQKFIIMVEQDLKPH